MKKVFICEDHQIFLDGLSGIINTYPKEFQIVETAKNGTYAASKIPFLDIDILLLDLNIPGLNGFEVIKIVREKKLPIKIILITMYDDPSMIKKAKEAGANAYLLKDVSDETLLSVMRNTENDKFFIQEGLNNPEHAMFKESFSSVVKLTMREKEVVQLVVKGNTTQQIADTLFLSVNTIETHRRNIYRKLEIKSLSELIGFANKYDLMN
ncbi:MAG: response regulator [Salibacteraceae bacterium]